MDSLSSPRVREGWLILFFALIVNCGFSQEPAATTNTDASSPIATIRTITRLIELDVVVINQLGRPVTGLTEEDFQVDEDNRPQPVLSFEVHTSTSDAPQMAPKAPQLPPNTFLNLHQTLDRGTPTVILYDALHTPLGDQPYAHKELLRFIKQRHPGMQIAIFLLSGRLHLLQGFTEDTDLLSAALASTKGSPQTVTQSAPGNSHESTPGDMLDPALQGILNDFSHMDGGDQETLGKERFEITLNALAELGRFFALIPGRKNLIWLSSTFPGGIFASSISPITNLAYSTKVKLAVDLLALSHVSIYPVDVRGVRAGPTFSAANNAGFGSGNSSGLKLSELKTRSEEMGARMTMDSIAESTGGEAFYGTNDLEEAVDHALTSGSTYYSLSYRPTNSKYDGSLRHIKVTLKKSGYTLAYRKTYYADDLEAAARAAADAPVSPLSPSLERGTPLAHDLLIEAHLDAAGPPVPATPAQMQVLSQYEAMRTKNKNTKPAPVMMQQYFISYGLIARQLDMPEDDKGAHQASLEFGMIAYDDDGRKLNGLDSRVDDAIPPSRYEKVTADGYHAVQSIAVPVTATSLRLAVRDIHSNRTGSLEVKLPLAKIDEAKPSDTKAKDQ